MQTARSAQADPRAPCAASTSCTVQKRRALVLPPDKVDDLVRIQLLDVRFVADKHRHGILLRALNGPEVVQSQHSGKYSASFEMIERLLVGNSNDVVDVDPFGPLVGILLPSSVKRDR